MLRFCCTYGRGTLPFVTQELEERFSVCELQDKDGKILFSLESKKDWKKLLDLKTVERLFHVISFNESEVSRIITDTEDVVKSTNWSDAFRAYEDLQGTNGPDEISAKKRKLDYTYRISVKLRPKYLIKFRDRILNVCRDRISAETDNSYSPDSFQIEICIHVGGGNIFIGIPLSREPLSKRRYLKHIGLRSTVAYTMAKEIKVDAAVVMDPMCGRATIVCEAAQLRPNCHFVGVDKNWRAAMKAQENAELGQHVDIVCADASCLPFREKMVDAICCDLPFGKKHCRGDNLQRRYTQWLLSWSPLLRRHCFTLLTSAQLAEHLESSLRGDRRAGSVEKHYLKLGMTDAWMLTCDLADS